MPHHDAAGVAREALGRFRGNARAVLEDRLTGLIRIRQHRSVDVHHDLVALARRAGVEAVVQRRFRDHGERVGVLPDHARGLLGADVL